MTQAVVQIAPVEGGYQAVCRTRDCALGLEGAPWKSEVHSVKAGAEEDAKVHRQWHRAQRPVPVEEAFGMSAPTVAQLIVRAGLYIDADIATALPGLTWHVTRPLKQDGIETIGDLSARTDEQLLKVPNFGARRLDALKAALAEVAA